MPPLSSRYIIICLFCLYGVLLACTDDGASSRGPAPQGASGCESRRDGRDRSSSYGLASPDDRWRDVRALLGRHCAACHAEYSDHENASAKIDAFIRVTDLAEGDEAFMPKGGARLSLEERTLLIEWRAAGMPGGDAGPGDGGDLVLGDDDGSGEEDLGGDRGNDDTSGVDTDGSDWGDDPPPPPTPAATGC